MKKAEATRFTILSRALELVYRHGYQATSIDEILAQTAVTKGAFYYHFKNKDEMGLAMINEVMLPNMKQYMVEPLLQSSSADALYKMMKTLLQDTTHFDVRFGCPLINLSEEMAPLNDAFRTAIAALTNLWQDAISKHVQQGKKAGIYHKAVNPAHVAMLVITGYAGIRNLGKLQGRDAYTAYLRTFQTYINSLK